MDITQNEFRDEMCELAKTVGMIAVDEYWRTVDLPTFTKEITYYIFIKGKTDPYLEFLLYDYRLELDKEGFVEFK